MLRLVLLLGLAGCGGDKDGDSHSGTQVAGCGALVTDPLPSVPSSEWSPDLGPTLQRYDDLAGRWTAATDCGQGDVGVKLIPKSRDELLVVREPYPAGFPCGCTIDPDNGSDEDFGLLATFVDLEVFIETWDDPAVSGRTVYAAGALFDSAAPFQIRGCHRDDVDPYLASAWDTADVVIRVAGGQLEGAVRLATDAGEESVCHLSNFRLVEAL